jgi:5-bromo-4-chloroindolyl phosphate hydrolysis protein
MSSNLEKADNALLWVVVAVVAFLAIGVFGAIVHTIMFAIKLIIVIAAIGVGVRVATAISGSAKRKELNR